MKHCSVTGGRAVWPFPKDSQDHKQGRSLCCFIPLFLAYLFGHDFSCGVSLAFSSLHFPGPPRRWGDVVRLGAAGGGLQRRLAPTRAPFFGLDADLQALGTHFHNMVSAGLHALLICGQRDVWVMNPVWSQRPLAHPPHHSGHKMVPGGGHFTPPTPTLLPMEVHQEGAGLGARLQLALASP